MSGKGELNQKNRDRWERERAERERLRDRLHAFALWSSRDWDEENEDDVAAALAIVDEFLAEEPSA